MDSSGTFDVNDAVARLFSGHGIDLTENDGWLRGADSPDLRLQALVVPKPRQNDQVIVLLSVRVDVKGYHLIEECFAGWGDCQEDAVRNSLLNFHMSSLHVLLSAFWNLALDDQIEKETWLICGDRWDLTIGNIGTRTSNGQDIAIPDTFFASVQDQIQSLKIAKDMIWARVFVAQMDGELMTSEFLVCNEPVPLFQQKIGELDWPLQDGYYSARLFLIGQRLVNRPRTMTSFMKRLAFWSN